MIHVLLTPPDERTTLDNIGVVQVGCLPPFAEEAFDAMRRERWIVTVVHNAVRFPDSMPQRVRGRAYLDRFLTDHPDLEAARLTEGSPS